MSPTVAWRPGSAPRNQTIANGTLAASSCTAAAATADFQNFITMQIWGQPDFPVAGACRCVRACMAWHAYWISSACRCTQIYGVGERQSDGMKVFKLNASWVVSMYALSINYVLSIK